MAANSGRGCCRFLCLCWAAKVLTRGLSGGQNEKFLLTEKARIAAATRWVNSSRYCFTGCVECPCTIFGMASVHDHFGSLLLSTGKRLEWISSGFLFSSNPHSNSCERKLLSENPKNFPSLGLFLRLCKCQNGRPKP